jgi:hypothetical protein
MNPSYALNLWKVRCIDEDTRELFDRALAILRSKGFCWELAQFRHLFREINEEQLQQLFRSCEEGRIPAGRIGGVSGGDYFETKAGRAINTVDLIEIMSGQKNPIIQGDPRSVIRLGPSNALDLANWTLQKSNDLAHYLQICDVIQRTEWLQRGATIENPGQEDERFEGPDLESTTAALILMRQFLPGLDDSFLNACRIYCAHVDDDRKKHWVQAEMQRFETLLADKPTFNAAKVFASMTHGDVVELFVYGTGLVHRKSRDSLEAELSNLYAQHSRREIVFGFHWVARCFLESPINVAPVIYSDFAHWIQSLGVPRPTRIACETFFASDPAKSDRSVPDPSNLKHTIRIRT